MTGTFFMDKAQFHHDGIINTRKYTLSCDNPHEVAWSTFQHRFSVNAWCERVGSHLCQRGERVL